MLTFISGSQPTEKEKVDWDAIECDLISVISLESMGVQFLIHVVFLADIQPLFSKSLWP